MAESSLTLRSLVLSGFVWVRRTNDSGIMAGWHRY